MCSRSGRVRCVLSLLFLICLVPPIFAGESQWVEVHSPNFSVVTDAGEKRGRDVAFHFEQMRAVFGSLMTKAKVNLPVPLEIVAFRNTKEMRQFAPLWKGKPTEVAGLFQPGQDRSFIMLDMSVENPWAVVFHEYAHQLMNGNVTAPMDPWFEEGFAEYFSSIEVDNKEARVGKIPEMEYRILQQDGMMKVADLFRVQEHSSVYNESGDHRTVFYAESGLVVHYLYDNNLILKLGDYFQMVIDKKMSIDDSVQQAFGMSCAQFDKTLRNYLSSGRFRYYPIPAPPGIASSGYTSKQLAPTDSAAVLADIHLHSADYVDKSIAEFQEILKTDPKQEASLRGMGYAYLGKRDFANAQSYFQRAIQADSKDPRVHYYAALLVNLEGLNQQDLETRQEMKKELETSIALDPNFADAYSLLAFARSSLDDKTGAIQAAQKAVSLNPRNESYIYNLAQVYLSASMVDNAIQLLKGLQGSRNPEVAMRASQSLAAAESFQEMQAAGRRRIVTASVPVNRIAPDHPADPQEAGELNAKSEVALPTSQTPAVVRFLKGKVTGVDCSAAPSAVVNVLSGTKTWKMHVRDTNHAILIGADKFSCGWMNQKVAINYRDRSDGDGDIISLEVQ